MTGFPSEAVPGSFLGIHAVNVYPESFNQQDEEFGEPRLIQALRRYQALSPAETVAGVLDDVRQFSVDEQGDDRTLIVARCRDDER